MEHDVSSPDTGTPLPASTVFNSNLAGRGRHPMGTAKTGRRDLQSRHLTCPLSQGSQPLAYERRGRGRDTTHGRARSRPSGWGPLISDARHDPGRGIRHPAVTSIGAAVHTVHHPQKEQAEISATLDDQGFDKSSPLVGDPIRPGTQPNWSRHHVDLAGETALYPQPGARVLRGDRDHRDGLPVVLPCQPTDELGLPLVVGGVGLKQINVTPGTAGGRDRRNPACPGDNQEGGSVLLGHAQGSAKRVAKAIQHHDASTRGGMPWSGQMKRRAVAMQITTKSTVSAARTLRHRLRRREWTRDGVPTKRSGHLFCRFRNNPLGESVAHRAPVNQGNRPHLSHKPTRQEQRMSAVVGKGPMFTTSPGSTVHLSPSLPPKVTLPSRTAFPVSRDDRTSA